MSGEAPAHRPIRSFVLRQGRMTPGQKKAWERLWPRYGLPADGAPLDLAARFGNHHPVYLEIGFGNGDALLARALATPEHNQLGIEVHRPGIGRLLQALDEHRLSNVRLLRADALEVLERRLPDASLAGVYLLFPDPWHKKRHHKRRIVRPAFIDQLARVLRPGGFFHVATDWEDYAEQIVTLMEAREDFINQAGEARFVARPPERPMTRFERRGQRLGHATRDMRFEKKPR